VAEHTLRVRVDLHVCTDSRISGDASCRQIQSGSDEVPVQSLRSIALPGIENNKLLHQVIPEFVLWLCSWF
jgi:hypothetical protein